MVAGPRNPLDLLGRSLVAQTGLFAGRCERQDPRKLASHLNPQAAALRHQHNRWRGEVPGWQVRRALPRAPVMVLSSIMEGGANVISEAVVAGVSVLASEIAGSVGLLGRDYPGYYPARDAAALARLMLRVEREPAFLAELGRRCAARAPLFALPREREAWRTLLARLRGAR